MWKRKVILGSLALGILIALACELLSLPPEGRPEARALNRAVTSGRDEQIARVLRGMGTNAIPYLLLWITDETQPWRTINPFSFEGRSRNRTYRRGEYAVNAFRILGPQAESAIPRLGELANNGQRGTSAGGRAALALSHLGGKAVPTLSGVLINTNSAHRAIAALALGEMGTNAAPAVPHLLVCLRDGDTNLAAFSADALGKLKLDAEHVIPALVACMTGKPSYARAHAAEAIGQYASQAQAAVPALIKAAKDPDQDLRTAAANAILRISPQAPTNASLP